MSIYNDVNYFSVLSVWYQRFSVSVQYAYGCSVNELFVSFLSLVTSRQRNGGSSNDSSVFESSMSASTIPSFGHW